jgi:hypothetical protein
MKRNLPNAKTRLVIGAFNERIRLHFLPFFERLNRCLDLQTNCPRKALGVPHERREHCSGLYDVLEMWAEWLRTTYTFKKSSRAPSQRAKCASTVAMSSSNNVCATARALSTSH